MKRRSFLQAVGGAVGSGALSGSVVAADPAPAAVQPAGDGLPRRVLGRTGKQVSVVGFPGLALVHDDQDRCTAALHDAFARGVNYFDVAPAYGNGDAEIKMGIGLQGLDRSGYYLACKTKKRDKQGCREELERSLDRLKTDHFDVYQMHCLITAEEVQQALGPGGALETMLDAQRQGIVKHLGFSAHTTKAALEAMRGFQFDTVMFPINFVEYHTFGFGKQVIELAAKQGAAVLAIKPMCGGSWPKDVQRTRRWWYRPLEEPQDIGLAMRFTLSLENVVMGVPPAFLELLDKALDVGNLVAPLTGDEQAEVRRMALARESLFRDRQIAMRDEGYLDVVCDDNPYEGCPGRARLEA
jgi:predicted aldo/keto reductase-like oxidoreductase